MTNVILTKIDDTIATVTLNRPQKLNALTRPMWRGLGDALNQLDANRQVRCIIVRGAGGKAFSPGNDISEFESQRSTPAKAKDYGNDLYHGLEGLSSCNTPTVALIEGICVGGGLEIAALCDLRICSKSSRFGVPIKRLGLVMAYPEISGLLQVAGEAVAREILLEGRIFGADEALQKGLVTRVVEDDQVEREAFDTAQRISDGAPLVAQWHKKFIRRLRDQTPLSEAERDEAYECYDTRDFDIGYNSFLNKTKPQFEGR
jgi:enoyl-CoA hydratase